MSTAITIFRRPLDDISAALHTRQAQQLLIAGDFPLNDVLRFDFLVCSMPLFFAVATSMRNNARPYCSPPLTTDAKILRENVKSFVTKAALVSWLVCKISNHELANHEHSHFVQESYLSQTQADGHFCVQALFGQAPFQLRH